MINKGIISSLLEDGRRATVTPHFGGIVTAQLSIPFYLVGSVPVGTEVVYAEFEDQTGLILHRLDGEWNHSLKEV